MTEADSDRPILGSYGAGPCFILALYDEKNKISLLAHISAIASLDAITQQLNHLSINDTIAHLTGGAQGSEQRSMEIIDLLKKNRITVVSADIIRENPATNPASLAIDTRTGKIYSPVLPDQLKTLGVKNRKGINQNRFLTECYNGMRHAAHYQLK